MQILQLATRVANTSEGQAVKKRTVRLLIIVCDYRGHSLTSKLIFISDKI